LLTAWPTAVHADGDEQATLSKTLSLAPWGLGVAWMAHLRPSQCSARVTATPEPRVKLPTPVQEDALGQETPASWPVRASRFRVGTIDHPRPEALADPAGVTFACAAAPTAGPSSTTAAPVATAARIRPRIATPHDLPGKCARWRRPGVTKQEPPATPRGALRGNLELPAPLWAKRDTNIKSGSRQETCSLS